MNTALCFLASYLYLQFAVLYSTWRAIQWDNPKWLPDSYAGRKKESKKTFAIAWIVITLFVFFLDMGFLYYGLPMWLDFDAWTKVRTLPILIIPLILTFTKTHSLHLFWLTWSIERLEERLKKNN